MRGFMVLIGVPMVIGLAAARELPAVGMEPFARGFSSPVELLPYRDGAQAFLVVDQNGVISFLGAKGGTPGDPFLDLRDRMVTLKDGFDERGLLGLALHPEFKTNGKLYVHYSAPLRDGAAEGYNHTAHISEFTVPAGSSVPDPSSERILLKVDEPQWNHNGGGPLFGPDGYLYLFFGDGGAANDHAMGHEEGGNGQSLDRLLGKVLRIDVNEGDPYGIPLDNPLVGKDGRDEIYAWGLRNPWGISFDLGGTGDLMLADVGQVRFEEIDIIRKGGNYGWYRFEGLAPFDFERPADAVDGKRDPLPDSMIAPVLSYPHNPTYGEAPGYGISVTGGHVYRGKALPGLHGVYVFADWAMSWATSKHGLYAGVRDDQGGWTMRLLPGGGPPPGGDQNVLGFSQDRAGELYVLTNALKIPSGGKGAIWKMVPADEED